MFQQLNCFHWPNLCLKNNKFLYIFKTLKENCFGENPQDTVDWGKKWLVDFIAEQTQLVLFDQSNNIGSIDVKMDKSVLEGKSSLKVLGLTFSSKLDWGFYIMSIAKTDSKKIGALICSMKFFSPEVVLYL